MLQSRRPRVFIELFYGKIKLNYGVISLSVENFPDFNPLGANHLMLFFNPVIAVGSRIAINFLYKALSKKIHHLRLNRDCFFNGRTY